MVFDVPVPAGNPTPRIPGPRGSPRGNPRGPGIRGNSGNVEYLRGKSYFPGDIRHSPRFSPTEMLKRAFFERNIERNFREIFRKRIPESPTSGDRNPRPENPRGNSGKPPGTGTTGALLHVCLAINCFHP